MRNACLVVYLEKRTAEVCSTGHGIASGQVRKDLAVHVSLSSIFTISKSRPLPLGGDVAGSLRFRNLRNSSLLPVTRQQTLPFQRTTNRGSATRSTSSASAGCIRDDNVCQHPCSEFRASPATQTTEIAKPSAFQCSAELRCRPFGGAASALAGYIWTAGSAVNALVEARAIFARAPPSGAARCLVRSCPTRPSYGVGGADMKGSAPASAPVQSPPPSIRRIGGASSTGTTGWELQRISRSDTK